MALIAPLLYIAPGIIVGAALALVYIMGSRSLAPCAAAHIGINLILEPWLILTSASGSWRKRSIPSEWAPRLR